jgi:ribosomal protein S27E
MPNKLPDSVTNCAPRSKSYAHVFDDIKCPHCNNSGAKYDHAGPAHWMTMKCVQCGRCFEIDAS